MDSGKSDRKLHPDCWGTLKVETELGPTDIENYTPTERALIVAYAAYPNFAEELNEIVLPSFDTMAEIRGQYPQEQFNFSFLASTVNFNNDDAPIPTLAPTLAKLQLVAETTSWHDLHGTRVKTVFTGNAAPPPMDIYSWYRIATNAHDPRQRVQGAPRALPQVHRRRAREAAKRVVGRVDAHQTKR